MEGGRSESERPKRGFRLWVERTQFGDETLDKECYVGYVGSIVSLSEYCLSIRSNDQRVRQTMKGFRCKIGSIADFRDYRQDLYSQVAIDREPRAAP